MSQYKIFFDTSENMKKHKIDYFSFGREAK